MKADRAQGVGLNVGRLVELDLAFLGPRVIVAEFAVGVAGGLALGLLSLAYAFRAHSPIWSWPVLVGLELVMVGINYVPLLQAAWRRRSDAGAIAATRAAMRHDPTEARSYSWRQVWILVPGTIVAFALTGRRENPGAMPS